MKKKASAFWPLTISLTFESEQDLKHLIKALCYAKDHMHKGYMLIAKRPTSLGVLSPGFEGKRLAADKALKTLKKEVLDAIP